MLKWELVELDLPLEIRWSIARSSTERKKNFVVKVSDDGFVGTGEVAWNTRFNESEKAIREGFLLFCKKSEAQFTGLENLIHLLNQMPLPNSLKFGLESAYTHLLSHLSNRSIQELLGVNTVRTLRTSFSIPIMEPLLMENFVKNYDLNRFHALKIKLSGGKYDESALKVMASLYGGKFYLDANESFRNAKQFFLFAEKAANYPVEFIEQPFPADSHGEYLEIKKRSPIPVFADESISSEMVTDYHADHFDGVNIKLMKSGGYFKAIRQMREAQERGLKVQLGCMIESSLGISSAMAIAHKADYIDLDGCLFLKEDPYRFVHEEKGKLFLSNIH